MSDRPTPHQSDVLPVDQAVGGDADSPGIAQPVTQDEIDDILNDQTMPIEERQMRLEDIRNRLGVRESADRGSDMSALEYQIDEALSLLADGGHVYGTLEGAGIDPSERADTRSPDDDESLGAPDAIGGGGGGGAALTRRPDDPDKERSPWPARTMKTIRA